MLFNIITGDLFTSTDTLVHCISSDYALGAGIAKQFEYKYGLRKQLHAHGPSLTPECIYAGGVMNLVTKRYYWDKPTYASLLAALNSLHEQCIKHNICKLSMPYIGCGLDKLKWDKVELLIKHVFNKSNYTITVYKFKERKRIKK